MSSCCDKVKALHRRIQSLWIKAAVRKQIIRVSWIITHFCLCLCFLLLEAALRKGSNIGATAESSVSRQRSSKVMANASEDTRMFLMKVINILLANISFIDAVSELKIVRRSVIKSTVVFEAFIIE